MTDTSLSLLNQLQSSSNDDAWPRLIRLYEPLLRRWLIRHELQSADVEDVLQNVLLAVSQEISGFQHNGRTGAFRSWLREVLIHRLQNHWRTNRRRLETSGGSGFQERMAQLADPCSELSVLWNQEHDQFLLKEVLTTVELQFSSDTWQAFRRVTLDGASPGDVAQELGISINAVFIAKSRVLSRLRREVAGLM